MTVDPEQIRKKIEDAAAGAHWGHTLSPRSIAQAEGDAGFAAPQCVRDLYLVGDGFREPRGNSAYLLPLVNDDGAGTVKSITLSYRQSFTQLQNYVIWGMTGGDEFWVSPLDAGHKIFLWSPLEPDVLNELGEDVFTVFEEDQRAFGQE